MAKDDHGEYPRTRFCQGEGRGLISDMKLIKRGILLFVIAGMLLGLTGCSSGSGGNCIYCGSHTSWRYVPARGWECYFCTH